MERILIMEKRYFNENGILMGKDTDFRIGLTEATPEQVAQYEADQLAKQTILQWKTNRQNEVDKIEVNYNGIIYQGDEVSQTRMARALSVMSDTDIFDGWVAKDNSLHSLTKADFIAILKTAGAKQSVIWNAGRP